jgi:hypothetical protein
MEQINAFISLHSVISHRIGVQGIFPEPKIHHVSCFIFIVCKTLGLEKKKKKNLRAAMSASRGARSPLAFEIKQKNASAVTV